MTPGSRTVLALRTGHVPAEIDALQLKLGETWGGLGRETPAPRQWTVRNIRACRLPYQPTEIGEPTL